MKIKYQFLTGLSSFCINIASATFDCDINNLTKPEHWKQWECDNSPVTATMNKYVISLIKGVPVVFVKIVRF